MTVIAITGHRPEQINNMVWVQNALASVFNELKPELIIQGMAAGVDLLSAKVAYQEGYPFVAARPWATHTPRIDDTELYEWALDNAERIDIVDDATSYLGPWLYHNRNEYMVNNADIVVAVWNGDSKGGTAACVRYAKKIGKLIVQINPRDETITYPQPEPETELSLF
jgi:uncharacterized phage-like protein YoqJ